LHDGICTKYVIPRAVYWPGFIVDAIFRMHITYYGKRYLYVGCTLNSFLLQSSLLVFPTFSFCYLYVLLQGILLHVCIGSMPLLNTTSP